MDKIIKEFKDNEHIYQLGYYLYKNYLYGDKVYPRIKIYKNEELLSTGCWGNGDDTGLFYFCAYPNSDSYTYSTIDTIKEMFTWLRQYSNIPEYIEKEFEELFILYKLNNFNEY